MTARRAWVPKRRDHRAACGQRVGNAPSVNMRSSQGMAPSRNADPAWSGMGGFDVFDYQSDPTALVGGGVARRMAATRPSAFTDRAYLSISRFRDRPFQSRDRSDASQPQRVRAARVCGWERYHIAAIATPTGTMILSTLASRKITVATLTAMLTVKTTMAAPWAQGFIAQKP